jgi:hypothetical protein
MLLVMVAAIGSYVLLAPPVIGLANQGDFARLMTPFGLTYPPNVVGDDRFWCFTDVAFDFTAPHISDPYFSSQMLFVAAALALHRLVSKSPWFDIRWLALVHLTALLVVFWKLAGTLQNATEYGRTTGLVLATLMVADVGYLAYFNTFYAEPSAILSAMALVAFLFDALRQPRPGNVCLLAGSAAVLATSKLQYAPFGLLMGLFFIAIPFLRREWRPLRALAIAAAALVAGAGILTAFTARGGLASPPLYATIFTGVLLDSDDPRRDLAELGIDPRAEAYKGSTPFEPHNAETAGYFPGHCTFRRILKFYLVHPVSLFRRTSRVIRSVMSNRPHMLGNFQRGYGYSCGEKAKCFSMWDPIRARFNSLPLAGGFFLVTAAMALLFAIRNGSAYSYGYLLLAAMAGTSFYVAALGDGADYRKHMVLFHFLFDCAFCIAAMFVADQGRRFLSRPQAAGSLRGRLLARLAHKRNGGEAGVANSADSWTTEEVNGLSA